MASMTPQFSDETAGESDLARGLALLARAGEYLAESLEYETTLGNVARLVVSEMADWCIVYSINEEGVVRRLAVECADPDNIAIATELAEYSAPNAERIASIIDHLREGQIFVNSDIDDELLDRMTSSPEHRELLVRMAITSSMAIPMVARGRFLGVIALYSSDPKRRYTDNDITLAQDLGRRAALAVDNALLYRRAQDEIEERRRAEEERNVLLGREQEQRRQLELLLETMQNIEVRVRRLFEANVVGIYFCNLDGEITDANEAFLDIIGYTREDLHNGRVRWDWITPEEYADVTGRAVTELRELGLCTPFEKEYIRKDGSRVAVLVGGAVLEGSADAVVSFVIDISERRSAEYALRESEERNRALLHAIPDLIFRFSSDGTMLDALVDDEQQLALPPQDFIDRKITDIFPESLGPKTLATISEVLATGEMRRFEYQLDCQGDERFYEARLVSSGSQEVMGIVRDITDRRLAEIQLRQAKEEAEEANRAKGQFLAVLSHELRTPLTPVLAAVDTLRDQQLPDDVIRLLDLIDRNVQLEARLIDDLLDLTRIEHGKLQLQQETTDAHQLVEAAIGICRDDIERKGLKLEMRSKAHRSMVQGDPARLQQVLWNLLRNAIKFTPAGGSIVVSTENTSDGQLLMTVADTGIGITPDILPRIFNAFEQGEQSITKQFGGMGLGLAISRMLVELHGGGLTAQSEGSGKGSIFSMQLDTVDGKRTSSESSSTVSTGTDHSSQPIRILIVDDHVDTGNIIRMLLERDGHLVETAVTLREALERADATSFDLLISDIGLPDGSGIELIEQLGDRRPPKAIALSGYGMEEDIRRSREVGFAEHLTKPVSMVRLREVITQLFS